MPVLRNGIIFSLIAAEIIRDSFLDRKSPDALILRFRPLIRLFARLGTTLRAQADELLRLAHYKHNNPVVVPGFRDEDVCVGVIPNSEPTRSPPILQASGKRRLASKESKTRKK